MNKPMGMKLFSPKTSQSKDKVKEGVPSKENELVIDNFNFGSKDDFDLLCNVVSLLHREYDCMTEVVKPEDCEEEEMARHKSVCYSVMNNSCIKEQNTFFERPHEGMKSNLNPFLLGQWWKRR